MSDRAVSAPDPIDSSGPSSAGGLPLDTLDSVLGSVFVGTDGSDTIHGSAGDDTIQAGMGADFIQALAGHDDIHLKFSPGFEHADLVEGGEGGDHLFIDAAAAVYGFTWHGYPLTGSATHAATAISGTLSHIREMLTQPRLQVDTWSSDTGAVFTGIEQLSLWGSAVARTCWLCWVMELMTEAVARTRCTRTGATPPLTSRGTTRPAPRCRRSTAR